jgi:hypothetical protein
MELNEWSSDLMTIAETARVLHVPRQLGARTPGRKVNSKVSGLFRGPRGVQA